MPALELRRIDKAFPNPLRGHPPVAVLRDFSLTVPDGQVLAVLGPSGIGKSTLLNLLALVEPPDAGEILFDGIPHGPADVGRRSVGYLFQRDALLPWRTALQNAVLAIECRGPVGPEQQARAEDYFRRFGLQGCERAWPHTLSGGQRQRVALIQNILADPELLLLDEPFGGLDFQTKMALEDELRRYLRGDGAKRRTVVLVTHDIPEGVIAADRVVVIGRSTVGILLDTPVHLSASERDPVAGRQSPAVATLFASIWAALRADGAGREP